MHGISTTYRRIAAILSVSLLLSIGAPLVQYVCASNGVAQPADMVAHHHDADENQHCDEHESSDQHDSHEDCADQFDLKYACCDIKVTQADRSDALVYDRTFTAFEDAVLLVTSEILYDDNSDELPTYVADASLSPPPVSLHVLHETFLN